MSDAQWLPANVPVEPDWARSTAVEAGRWYSFGAEINPHTGEQTSWCEPMEGPPDDGGFIEVTLESGEVLTTRQAK